MPAEADLYAKLTAAPAVSAIVGTQIHSDLPDEEVAPPYLFYERIDTEIINSIHNGLPLAEIASFAVVCFAETREAAEALGDAAMAAAAGDNTFVYIGRQGEYDPETRLFAAAIQLQHHL